VHHPDKPDYPRLPERTPHTRVRTHEIHPGAGRSPGIVDLPVIRDPLGYPYIPATQLKGALKAAIARAKGCTLKKERNMYKIDCGVCSEVCALFGGEQGQGDKGAAAVALTDAYPLLLPAPNPDEGVIYVTTPYLLGKARALAEAAGGKLEITQDSADKKIFIGVEEIEAAQLTITVDGGIESLNPLYAATGVKAYVIKTPEATTIIERLLSRVTRVSLDRVSKTVAQGPWTEEYFPAGTLFAAAAMDTGFRNEFAQGSFNPLEKLRKAIEDSNGGLGGYLVVGGKETVGAGILKLKVV